MISAEGLRGRRGRRGASNTWLGPGEIGQAKSFGGFYGLVGDVLCHLKYTTTVNSGHDAPHPQWPPRIGAMIRRPVSLHWHANHTKDDGE
jgi:hypothetical protein